MIFHVFLNIKKKSIRSHILLEDFTDKVSPISFIIYLAYSDWLINEC